MILPLLLITVLHEDSKSWTFKAKKDLRFATEREGRRVLEELLDYDPLPEFRMHAACHFTYKKPKK